MRFPIGVEQNVPRLDVAVQNTYFEQALGLDPRNVELLSYAAMTYGWLRQFPAALKLYDRAIQTKRPAKSKPALCHVESFVLRLGQAPSKRPSILFLRLEI